MEKEGPTSMATIPPDFQIGLGSGRRSDDELRTDLEELIKMRRAFEAGEQSGPHIAFLALLSFAELANGLMGWVAQSESIVYPPDEYSKLSVTQVQTLLATTFHLGLPVMQPEARELLIEALEGLRAGYDPPLFKRTGRRRRVAPHRTAETELRMLMWVHWQRGRGRRAREAQSELVEQAGVAPQTIRKWPSELGKVYGAARVRLALELAEAVGTAEAEGKGNLEDFRPMESERGHQLWVTSSGLERRLGVLVQQRRAAVAKRRTPS
jgi:hypothetical protein